MSNTDATQYLLELRNQVNEAWFHAVCDLALNSRGAPVTESSLNEIYELFYGARRYTPMAAYEPQPPTTQPTSCYFLESIDKFNGFKKLSNGLEIKFDKRITLIFGKNGSGKSTVCDAVKVLANPNGTSGELRNVYQNTNQEPRFNYKFQSEPQPRTWSSTVGYGAANGAIKYFDSTIAVRNITDAAKPSDAVEVSLFRLEVFDFARDIVNNFNSFLTRKLHAQASEINTQIESAKLKLQPSVDTTAEPFLNWSAHNYRNVLSLVESLPQFDDTSEHLLQQKQTMLASIDTALSQGGVQALKGQQTILNQVYSQLHLLCDELTKIVPGRMQQIEELITQKEGALIELGDFNKPFVALITQASQLKNLGSLNVSSDTCPLCNEPITPNSQALFRRYHAYLTSQIQSELSTLKLEISHSQTALQTSMQVRFTDVSSCDDLLPPGFKTELESNQVHLVALLQKLIAKNYSDSTKFTELKNTIIRLKEQLANSKSIVDTSVHQATTDRGNLEASRKTIANEIAQMTANRTVHVNRAELNRLCNLCKEHSPKYFRVNSYDFSSLLRKLSTSGKNAHNDLILNSFESKLSEEYMRLTGASHSERGISLHTRSSNQVVYATPKIGSSEVTRVLSEGEQKVHSLAVFFCEASVNTHQVLVFDDPVTSFDYNHISNFCERIRDFANENTNTQLIILTHNWDFFASLQLVLKRMGNLHNQLSVQVLENCATVQEYVEKWEVICSNIESILGMVEPVDDMHKELLSSYLRRLIERLANAYVFNEQRHQYKVKSLKVTEFNEFTKVVPLTIAEADKLRDLYANLSPSEHDDIRNQYTSRNLSEFRQWYIEICSIKDALIQRRAN